MRLRLSAFDLNSVEQRFFGPLLCCLSEASSLFTV